ncbi:hypothetical protein MN608_04638 [Microdochium nivale]|nr:hypothetical protein MN608_04638 [Microdochium nivale]
MTASNTTPHQRSSMFSVCKNLTGLPGSEFWHLLGPPSSPPQASSPLSSSSPSPSPGRQGVDSQARGPDNIGTLRIFPPVPRVPVGSRNPGATTTTMITSQRTLPPIPSSPPPSAATASQQSRSPRLVLPLRVNTSAHNEQLLRASPEQASRQEQHETPYRTGDENSGYYNQQQRRQQQQIHDFWQHQHQHQQGQMPTRPVRDMTRREPLPRVRHYDAAQEHADGTGAYPQHIDRTATWPAMPNSSPLEALHIPLLSMTDSRRQRQQPQPALAPLTLESLQYLNKTQQQQPDSTRKDHYFSYNDGYKKKKNNGRDLDSNGVSPLSSPGSSVDGDGNGQSWRDYVVSPVSSVSSP